jgi:hypothetical protein
MLPIRPYSLLISSSFFYLLDRGVRIPSEDAEKSGLAADQVKINEKYGGGFPANVEGLHHLHCLVRPFVFPDFHILHAH